MAEFPGLEYTLPYSLTLSTGTGRGSGTQLNSLPLQSYCPSAHQAVHGYQSRAGGQGSNSSKQEWNEVWTKQLAVSSPTCAAPHVLQKPDLIHATLPLCKKRKCRDPQILYSMEFEKWPVIPSVQTWCLTLNEDFHIFSEYNQRKVSLRTLM